MGNLARRLYLGVGLLAAAVQLFTFATGLSSLSDTWRATRVHAAKGPQLAQWVSNHEFPFFFPVLLALITLSFASAQRIEPSMDSRGYRLGLSVVWYTSFTITLAGAALWFAVWAFLGFPWR